MIYYFDMDVDDVIQIGDIASVQLTGIKPQVEPITKQFTHWQAQLGFPNTDRSVQIDREEIAQRKRERK